MNDRVKKFVKDNIFFIAVFILAAGVALALNILYPYSGDDWYWAAQPFSLSSLIELNGRYMGTLIALIITKLPALRVIICFAVTMAAIYFLSLAGENHRWLFFLAAAALFMVMPVSISNETLVWASGFANYTPSALIVIVYITLIKNEFADKAPVYGKAAPYIAAALGAVGALFMETVTIGNIIVGAAVLIYHLIRFKKPETTLIAFLGGAVAGAALMFINPVYFQIAGGQDPDYERSIDFLNIASAYFNTFQYFFAYDNFWLNLFLTAMLTWLAAKNFALLKKPARAGAIISFAVKLCFLVFSGADYFGKAIVYFRLVGVLKGILTFAFCSAVLADVLLLIKDVNVKLRCVFLIGCLLAYSLTLLVVFPVGGRNFMCAYLLFAALALTVLGENLKDTSFAEKPLAIAVTAVSLAAVVSFGIVRIGAYSEIHSAYVAREERIIKQLEEGAENIEIDSITASGAIGAKTITYVHNVNPDNSYFMKYFREYYGISPSVSVSLPGYLG